MSEPNLEEIASSSDSNPINAIAEETQTSPEIVKTLYEAEVAALEAQATVTAFVRVIARQKVKRRLKQGNVPEALFHLQRSVPARTQ